ncbi:hypothetical protein AYL99_11940 [Fonsecaea erecta]|uniref:Uncharacterized protein n=1 Tax=Fonsecaea erecta TaxID=1367422 RepID=A0A178Z288_9EURO|nr:hypothetical protein AYL99_11940 [Fonsecaea erecta]OAP53918.1 hypothetical protein AYL99_11940 [Fonsecaea erecta]
MKNVLYRWAPPLRVLFCERKTCRARLPLIAGVQQHLFTRQRRSTQSLVHDIDSLDQFDEEFIHRRSEATCSTMGNRYELFPVSQVTVPALTLDQPFLKYGLLTLAAMHIRFTPPLPLQSKYLDIASQRQDRALEGYIPLLEHISAANCHALQCI